MLNTDEAMYIGAHFIMNVQPTLLVILAQQSVGQPSIRFASDTATAADYAQPLAVSCRPMLVVDGQLATMELTTSSTSPTLTSPWSSPCNTGV